MVTRGKGDHLIGLATVDAPSDPRFDVVAALHRIFKRRAVGERLGLDVVEVQSVGLGEAGGAPRAQSRSWWRLPRRSRVDSITPHLAPARTPPAILHKLNAELARILQLPEIREQLAREGSEPALGTPEQLRKHIAAEIARLGKIINASGARNP